MNFREAMFLSSNGSSEIAVQSYLRSPLEKRDTIYVKKSGFL